MATVKQIEKFIEEIAPIVCKYAKENGYNYPSGIIAQAIHESGVTSKLATKYFNLWGMKCGSSYTGKSTNLKTVEYYDGVKTEIKDNFRAYDTLEEGIKGYFDFIKMKRYQNLKQALNGLNYCERIYDDGWATGPKESYLNACKKYIDTYRLEQYDTPRAQTNVVGIFEITAKPSLRIRTEPSILSKQVGSLKTGAVIVPTESRAQTDGSIWVRIKEGWCCRRLCGIDYMKSL